MPSDWTKEILGTTFQLNNAENITYNLTVADNDEGAEYIANMRKNYSINRNDDCSEFDNVISNSAVTSVVEQNSGTISAPPTKSVNGKIYNFAGWTDDFTAPNSRTITPINNTTYTALYKFPTHTNNSSTFSNTSQRNIVRTPEGVLHMVYESMGKAWYERSSDDGVTWELVGALNQGRDGKNPSIDFVYEAPSQATDGYITIGIIYDGDTGWENNWAVIIENFWSLADENQNFGNYLTHEPYIVSDVNNLFSESHNSNPVIALGLQDKTMAIWLNELGQLKSGYGNFEPISGFVGWNTGYPKEIIINGGTPIGNKYSLVSTKDYDYNDLSSFYFVVELKSTGTSQSSVLLSKLKSPNYIDDLSDEYFLESKYINSNPSVSLITDQSNNKKLPLVAWMAKDLNADFQGYAKIIDWDSGKNLISSLTLGNNVKSIQTTAPYSGDNEAIVAWSENNSTSIRYVNYQNSLFSFPGQLSESGTSFSLCNGGQSNNQIRAFILNTSSSPYEIKDTGLPIPTTISSNCTIGSGTYHSSNNITINSGVILTIQAGTNITFQNNSSLIVNGTLNVNGTSSNEVVFDFVTKSGGNGIKVYSGGSANIDYAEIKNADYGLYINGNSDDVDVEIKNSNIHNCSYGVNTFYDVNLYVKNCIFEDNTSYGISLTYGGSIRLTGNHIYDGGGIGIHTAFTSYVNLHGNLIENNSETGIFAGYGSVLKLGKPYYAPWGFAKNTIKENGYHEIYAGSGNPIFELAGNSVHDNTGYEIYNYSSNSQIFAQQCWFGGALSYYGTVTNNSPLSSLTFTETTYDDDGNMLMPKVADNSKIPDKYRGHDGIIALKEKLKSKKTSNEIKLKALRDLYSVLRADFKSNNYSERNKFYNFLETNLKNSSDRKLTDEASKYQLYWLFLNKEYATAIDLAENMLNSKSTKDDLGVMLQLTHLYLLTNQFERAEKELGKAVSKYGKENIFISNLIEEIEMNEKLYKNISLDENSEKKKIADNTIIPTNTELSQNYPNPFNPTTQISYQISKDGFVNLVVYNSLGQEVATLVNKHQTIGKYSVQFNTVNLPSGVYFYRLESGNFTKVNKMLFLK